MGLATKVFALNVGRERTYLELRHRLLTEAGYTVTSAESVQAAEAAIRSKSADVLVIGAWVPKAERNQLVRLVKESNRAAKIIFYYDQNIDGTEEADAILNFRGDHSDLVRTVQHLLAKATRQESGGGVSRKLRGIAGLVVAALTNPLFIGV